MYLAHPLAVAAGQVVVDGDDVHALAGQRVEIGGQHGHEGLALAGLHLGDAALMQHHAADQLHAEGLHAQHAPRGLAHGGVGLGQDVVERLAVCEPILELLRLGAKLRVRQSLHRRLQLFDSICDRIDLFQLPVGIAAEELVQKTHSQFLCLIGDSFLWGRKPHSN